MYKVEVVKTIEKNFINYTYIVIDLESMCCVIIDPAWELSKYVETVNNLNLNVNGVLLTHHHHDHTNLASEISNLYACPVYISTQEAVFYDFSCGNMETFDSTQEILSILGVSAKPIITPGHTAGSTCYMIGSNIFTGDTLFIEGCGVCDTSGGDPFEMYKSVKKLIEIVPDHYRVYPGHQYKHNIGSSFAEVKKVNIYTHFDDPEDFVQFRSRKGQTGLLNFT